MRRFSAVAVAACAALSLAPAAHAETTTPTAQVSPSTYVQLVRVINGGVENADCNALGSALRLTKMANAETTRAGLVANLNKAVGDDTTLRLLTGSTVNAAADRALVCGVVKPDPVTPQTRLVQLSSELSSRAGLPDAKVVLPALGL